MLQQVRTSAQDSVSITLVGNKIDLEGKRRVSSSMLRQFSESENNKVGKTAICRQFVNNDSPREDLNATIGVDLNLKVLKTKGVRVKLQIWDTAGQER